jgi:hypothetical protein
MMRRGFPGSVAFVLFLLLAVRVGWSADPYGSMGGYTGTAQSTYSGTGDWSSQGFGYTYPFQQTQSPTGYVPYLLPQEDGPTGGGVRYSEEPPPELPPLPPEGQSAFEQLVSGKIEITKSQLDVVRQDPAIVFTNAPSDEFYQATKSAYHDPERLRAGRHTGAGARTLFLDLLDWIATRRCPTVTLGEVNADWRSRS